MEGEMYLPLLVRGTQVLQEEGRGGEGGEWNIFFFIGRKHDQWQNQNKYERTQMSVFTLVGGHKPEDLAMMGKGLHDREDMGFALCWLH